jgi:hypothetical protein
MVVDEFMAVLSPSAFKMMVFLVRQTIGFQSVITDSTAQSRVIDKTGLSKTTVWRCQIELKKHNLIKIYGSKKEGYSYEVGYKIVHDFKFKTFLMFQNETLNKYALMFQNETSYVSNWNILYILNTLIKNTNKKYIKKNEGKSSAKSKKENKAKGQNSDLKSKEIFEEFKSKFTFINFEDYVRMVEHLGKLHGAVTKTRISKNLGKCKMKDKKTFIDSDDFNKVVSDFVKQVKYQGVFVSWDIQMGREDAKGKNRVDELPVKKSENTMTDEELDAEIAKKLGEVA